MNDWILFWVKRKTSFHGIHYTVEANQDSPKQRLSIPEPPLQMIRVVDMLCKIVHCKIQHHWEGQTQGHHMLNPRQWHQFGQPMRDELNFIKPKLFQWVKPTLFNVILSITPSFWSFNLRKWVVLIPYAVHFCCNIDRYQNYFLFWPRSHIASISPRVTLAHPANVSTCVISLSQSKVGTENNKVRSVPMTSDPITKGFWVTTCYIYIISIWSAETRYKYIYI